MFDRRPQQQIIMLWLEWQNIQGCSVKMSMAGNVLMMAKERVHHWFRFIAQEFSCTFRRQHSTLGAPKRYDKQPDNITSSQTVQLECF